MARFMRYGEGRRNPAWGGGASAPGGGATPASEPAPTPGGTGWVNVQNYLDANKGAAGEMGQKAASEMDALASQAAPEAEKYRSDLATFKNTAPVQVQTQAYKNWLAARQAAHDRLDAGGMGDQERWLGKWEQDNPQPNAWEWSTPRAPSAPSRPGEVLSQIKTLGTPEGMADYFAQKAGATYTTGQGALDSYLARAGGGAQAMQGVQSKWGKTLDLLGSPGPTPSMTPGVGDAPIRSLTPGKEQPDAPVAGGMAPATPMGVMEEQPQRTRFTSGRLPKTKALLGWST